MAEALARTLCRRPTPSTLARGGRGRGLTGCRRRRAAPATRARRRRRCIGRTTTATGVGAGPRCRDLARSGRRGAAAAPAVRRGRRQLRWRTTPATTVGAGAGRRGVRWPTAAAGGGSVGWATPASALPLRGPGWHRRRACPTAVAAGRARGRAWAWGRGRGTVFAAPLAGRGLAPERVVGRGGGLRRQGCLTEASAARRLRPGAAHVGASVPARGPRLAHRHGQPPDTGGSTAISSLSSTAWSMTAGSPFTHTRLWSRTAPNPVPYRVRAACNTSATVVPATSS